MSTIKVTRKRVTYSDRIKDLDAQIEASQNRTRMLLDKRDAIVTEAKERAAEMLRQVGEGA